MFEFYISFGYIFSVVHIVDRPREDLVLGWFHCMYSHNKLARYHLQYRGWIFVQI